VLAVGILASGAVSLASAAGGPPSSGVQGDRVNIGVEEPIGVELFLASKEATGKAGQYVIIPGETILFDYRITNSSSLAYVVEIHPAFEGPSVDIPWELGAVGSGYQYVANPSGPSHLFVQAGGAYHITLTISLPRDGPAGFSTSFVFYVHRTDCIEVQDCPWE